MPPATVELLILSPSDCEALKAGHWNAPFDVGSPYSAMDVHAETMEALMRSSADVKLQVPFGGGWSTRLPNTKGISAVCVGPKAGRP